MKNAKPVRKSSRTIKAKVKEDGCTSESSRILFSKMSSPSARGSKRPSLSPDILLPSKVRKTIVDGREVDSYCWICHRIGHDTICKSCPRVYHSDCADKEAFNTKGSCPECQLQSVGEQKEPCNISRSSLKELLKCALQEALKDGKKIASRSQSQPKNNSKFCKYFTSWPVGNTEFLCQIIDLAILFDKINHYHNCYLTTAEFFSDVKWIYHNCYILHGPNSEITETAWKLEKNIKAELLDIEACAECYFMLHSDKHLHADFFTVLCKKPHDIIWAKLRGSPYWPAKCLKNYNGHAEVRFFGTHDKSCIPVSQCFRVSHRSPNDREIRQTKYQDAISELSVYISNYKRVYGNFQYFPPKTPLEDSKSFSKKPQRKGRHRRSGADKSSESVKTSGASAEEEIHILEESVKKSGSVTWESPEASNGSVVHSKIESEASETGELPHEDSDSFPPREDNPREPMVETVSVCMDFTEEATLDTSGTTLNDPSQSSCLPETPVDSTQDMFEVPNTSIPFVNSNGPDALPVITSAISGEISNEDPMCFAGEDSPSDPAKVLHMHNVFVNHSNVSDSESNPAGHVFDSYMRQLSPDDNDIQILYETKKESKAVNSLLKNRRLANALYQVAATSRPDHQNFLAECLEFGMKSYLHLGLSATLRGQEENAVNNFSKLYEQMEKASQELKKENDCLRMENDSLKQENAFLRQDSERLQEKIKEFQEINQILETRHKNSKTVISILLSKVSAQTTKPNAEPLKPSNELLQCNQTYEDDDNSLLKVAKLKELEKMLADRDAKLKKLDVSEKNCLLEHINENVESHSDLPDGEMFTDKELQEMKELDIPYEENSSESQEALLEGEPYSNEDPLKHSHILRHQTFSTSIQHSSRVIMYAEESTANNVHTMFDSANMLMSDCSIMQPISVVSTPPPLLLSDVIPPSVVLSAPLPCMTESKVEMAESKAETKLKVKKKAAPKK